MVLPEAQLRAVGVMARAFIFECRAGWGATGVVITLEVIDEALLAAQVE